MYLFGHIFFQVNRGPSFATDSKLDLEIKFGVIRDAINIVNIKLVNVKQNAEGGGGGGGLEQVSRDPNWGPQKLSPKTLKQSYVLYSM